MGILYESYSHVRSEKRLHTEVHRNYNNLAKKMCFLNSKIPIYRANIRGGAGEIKNLLNRMSFKNFKINC